ncbi:hypothetical protein D3C76_743260 [compost metagenome]
MRLGAQQGQGLLAGCHRADVQAPGAALLHQHFAAGVVVVHDQYPCTLQWAVQVAGWMFQAVRVQWQGQPQRAALAAAALDAKLTVHQEDQLACDHQPQVAPQASGGEDVLAIEFSVQQGLTFFGFHGLPAVLHGNAQARCIAQVIQGHDDQDLAFLGLLHGVFQQAQQGLAQPRRVTADHPGNLGLDEADEFDVLLFGLGAEDAQTVFDQRIEVELHVVQFDLP